MHEVLVNRLGGLSLPRKSVVRLTDRPDMTLDVYSGRKTTMQMQRLTQEPEVGPHTFISPFSDLRRAVVSYWGSMCTLLLIICLGGLSLPRNSVHVVRLTDHPDMTIAVYHEHKGTKQHQQNPWCDNCIGTWVLISSHMVKS